MIIHEIALDENGSTVYYANAVKGQKYFCSVCNEPFLVAEGKIKQKHFRHETNSVCAATEPETLAHHEAKAVIEQTINELGVGTCAKEYSYEKRRVDVFWDRPNLKPLAIEVQGTNYTPEMYELKINEYRRADFQVFYVFLPGDFYNQIRKNIFRLSKIESSLLVKHAFGWFVGGAYLLQNSTGSVLEYPSFTEKYAKGGGYNTDTFYFNRDKTIWKPLRAVFEKLSSKEFVSPYFSPEVKTNSPTQFGCSHEKVKATYNVSKKSFCIRCDVCHVFIKWLGKSDEKRLKLLVNNEYVLENEWNRPHRS